MVAWLPCHLHVVDISVACLVRKGISEILVARITHADIIQSSELGCLREAVQGVVLHEETVAEVGFLLEVDAEVEEGRAITVGEGCHEAHLVEAVVTAVVGLVGLGVLNDTTHCDTEVVLAEETQRCGVVRQGRDICAECTHCSSHSYVACRADDIGRAGHSIIGVGVLSLGGCSEEHKG